MISLKKWIDKAKELPKRVIGPPGEIRKWG
jgi:hypothetical protein